MKKHSPLYRTLAVLMGLTFFMASCQQDDNFGSPQGNDNYITLQLSCSEMMPAYTTPMADILDTRAATAYTGDEKRIKSLHLFFFDAATHKLADISKPDNKIDAPYLRFYDMSDLQEAIKVPRDCFVNEELIVVALANIEGADPTKQAVFKTSEDETVNDSQSFVQTLDTSKEYVAGEETTDNDDDVCQRRDMDPITCLEDLEKWVYVPRAREYVRELPAGGMPMMSRVVLSGDNKEGVINTGNASLQRITLRAMMARVEVFIRLEPNQTSRDGTLPKLTVDKYTLKNLAMSVPYTQPTGEGNNISDLKYGNIRQPKWVTENIEQTITANGRPEDKTDLISLVYYTYENMQGTHEKLPIKDENGEQIIDENGNSRLYPVGVETEADKQRWKPIVAKENEIDDKATAIVINGRYTTHQGFTYNATFTIYLGENTVNNFNVKRNHCYTNHVTIHGLDYVRNDDDGVYTFDGRVNVIDENNVWYMSIVNERKVDAHASVLPMDIYLVLREGTYKGTEVMEHPRWSEISISLRDDTEGDNYGKIPDWVGFEMVPYAGEGGMIEDPKTVDNRDGTFTFTAGTKAKEYFYYDLVKNPNSQDVGEDGDYTYKDDEYGGENEYGLRKRGKYRIEESETDGRSRYIVNGKTVYETEVGQHIEGPYSRMRIYFYVDENVPKSAESIDEKVPERHASVILHYQNSNGVERDRTIEIDQSELLLVNYPNKRDKGTTHTCYIESYEEYLTHSDPLDKHDMPAELYEGLDWGLDGEKVLDNANIPNNIKKHFAGRTYTQGIIGKYEQSGPDGYRMHNVKLYNTQKPVSAIHYAYGKNKRNSDGSVYTGGVGLWEMPGIGNIESAMSQYYATFSEFQDRYYWSASPATQGEGGGERSDAACATTIIKYSEDADAIEYAESSKSGDAGWQPRTKINRIRVVYKTNAQNNQ